MKRVVSLIVGIAIVVLSYAEEFSITFRSNNGADSSAPVSLMQEIILETDVDIYQLTSSSTYLGKSGYGLKFGTSTKKGELTIQLTNTYMPTKMVVWAAVWKGATGMDNEAIVVGNKTIQLTHKDTLAAYTIDFDGETPLNTISIAGQKASKNRFYVQKIVIEAPNPKSDDIILSGPEMVDLGFGKLNDASQATAKSSVKIAGQRLTGDIKIQIEGDSKNCFSTDATSLGSEGGTITITANAQAVGIYTGRLRLSAVGEDSEPIITHVRLAYKVVQQATHAGTKADPYTVTDAAYLASLLKDATPSEDSVYVRGVIEGGVSITQGEADMLLMDSVSQIKVYKLHADNKETIEQGMLNHGDTILVYTLLYNRRGVTELHKGALVTDQLVFTDWSVLQPNYYDQISMLSDSVLKEKLSGVIYSPIRYTYGSGERSTWAGFYQTDRREEDNSVMDMYSDSMRYFIADNPTVALKDLDIEHILPKSWWGGEVNEAYQDLHHLVPADYSANRSKSNLPPGIVRTATFDNGSFKTGVPDETCEADKVFEPADEYKGDFARAYFYIATAYTDYTWDMSTHAKEAMTNESYLSFQPWLVDLLLSWHRADPVSVKEIRRQSAVSKIQHNRNPYIDYPCLVEYIWGKKRGEQVDFRTMMLTTTEEYEEAEDKSGCDCDCGSSVEATEKNNVFEGVYAYGHTIYGLSSEMRIYTVLGVDVTSSNGLLPCGTYIVVNHSAALKVML